MSIGQNKALLEQLLRLAFKIGKVLQLNTGHGAALNAMFHFMGRRKVEIIVSIDDIQQVPLTFGREDGSLLVNPPIEFVAGALEMRPGVCIAICPKTQNPVIELQNRLLKMVGDLKTFELNVGQTLAQISSSPPRVLGRPDDKRQDPGDRQDERR